MYLDVLCHRYKIWHCLGGRQKKYSIWFFNCDAYKEWISHRVLRDATYDPGHWTFYFYRRGFGLVVGVVVPSMLAVLPYARGRGFDSRSRLLHIRSGCDLLNYSISTPDWNVKIKWAFLSTFYLLSKISERHLWRKFFLKINSNNFFLLIFVISW
jgi:hypothetical protein